MSEAKLEAWQKIIGDQCDYLQCEYASGECLDMGDADVAVSHCGFFKIKQILFGKISVPDKAQAIIDLAKEACSICVADWEGEASPCDDDKTLCIFGDLLLVGEGKK